MDKKSQKQIILDKLLKEGFVDNLWAIQHYILRLGARIADLRSDGYEIETEFNTERVGKNCHYKLVKETLF